MTIFYESGVCIYEYYSMNTIYLTEIPFYNPPPPPSEASPTTSTVWATKCDRQTDGRTVEQTERHENCQT